MKTTVAPSTQAPPAPVLKVTRFDRVLAAMIAVFFGVALSCLSIVSAWWTTRLPTPRPMIAVELLELPGGFEDGSPNDSLQVDAPLPEDALASPTEAVSEQLEIAESLESVLEISDAATEPVQQQAEAGAINTGRAGSARGSGQRALGFGPGKSGVPREQRWFLRFADRSSLDEYAAQLQFFGIELGALLSDGRIVYVSQLTQGKPAVRYAASGQGENRLYMTWQGGERRFADIQLFAKAGLDIPAETTIFHFYTPELEQRLAALEREYRGQPVEKIKRTYFGVQADGSNYRLLVQRQLLFE